MPQILQAASDKMPVEYIDDARRLKDVCHYLGRQGQFAWDHETRSTDFLQFPEGALRRMEMRTDLVSFATREQAYVVVTGHIHCHKSIPEKDVFRLVKPMMEDNRIVHYGWNAPFDMDAMANNNVWVQNFRDAMVMAYLLDENQPRSLKHRCRDIGMDLSKFDFKLYWKNRAIRRGELDPPKRARKDYLSEEEFKELEARYLMYSAEDSIATILLADVYEPQLKEIPKLWHLFINHRNPAARSVFLMQRRGMAIDPKHVASMDGDCSRDMLHAEGEVYKEVGRHFNIGSTKVLAEILYDEMNLPVYKLTEKGAKSTDAATLAKLAQGGYPVAQKILRYRHLSKLYSAFIGPDAALQREVYPWNHIHASYNPVGTTSGRLSCSGPNLQQSPRSSEKTYHFRRAFVPSCPSYTLLGADYSQIELRIMCHMSQDPEMLSEYRKDEALMHAILQGKPLKDKDGNKLFHASDIHQKTADSCNSTRNLAKAINFGLLYGMGANTLAGVLTLANWDAHVADGTTDHWDVLRDVVDKELANSFRTNFFDTYRGVQAYQEFIGDLAFKYGYVESRFGQRRRLPDLYSTDKYMVFGAKRQAVNFTIQGHVGELMLHCMNIIEGAVKSQRKEIMEAADCLRDCKYRLIAQIHDEIVGEAPKRYTAQCKPALATIFQCPMPCTKEFPFFGYRVPLLFEISEGPSWAQVH